MQKDTAVCVTDRKEMLKTLIHHELLWLIDNPDKHHITAVTDWLLRLNEIYDNEGNLIHAYKKVCEIYED
jgi:hypothetical protein